MNKIYKVVWSKVKNCYVVVSELAKNIITGGVKSAKVGTTPMAKGLALGAAMAFVITGNVWAAEKTIDASKYSNNTINNIDAHLGETVKVIGQNITVAGSLGAWTNYGPCDEEAIIVAGDSNTDTVTIKDAQYGIIAYGDGASITVNANTLTIQDSYAGIWGANRSDSTGDNFEWNEDKTALITDDDAKVVINAGTTTIKDCDAAIVAQSQGTVEINGNLYATGTSEVLDVRGESVTNINKANDENVTVQLKGDIVFDPSSEKNQLVDANVNINLANKDSWFEGQIRNDAPVDLPEQKGKVTGMKLGLSNGAEWRVTNDSFVNTLAGNGGKLVNKSSEDKVTVTVLGEGSIPKRYNVYENVFVDDKDAIAGSAITNKNLNVDGVDLVIDTEKTAIYNQDVTIKSNADVTIKSQEKGVSAYGEVGIEAENVTISTKDDGIFSAGDANPNDVGNVNIKANGNVNITSAEGYAVNNASINNGKVNVSGEFVTLVSNDRTAVKVGHMADDEGYNGVVNIGDENTKTITIEGKTQDPAGDNERKSAVVYAQGDGTVNLNATVGIGIKNTGSDKGAAIGAYNEGKVIVNGSGTTTIDGDIKAEGNSEVSVLLNNEKSSLTGSVATANGATTALTMNDGATWNVTGDSKVSVVAGNEGNIDVTDIGNGKVTIKDNRNDNLTVTKDAKGLEVATEENLGNLMNTVVDEDGKAVSDAATLTNATIAGDVTMDANGDVTTTLDTDLNVTGDVVAGDVSLQDTAQEVERVEEKFDGQIGRLDNRIDKVEDRVDKVGAMAAAMASLRTMGYDPEAPTEIAVGVGQYRSETGLAIGAFHYPNKNFMLNFSLSTAGDEVMGGIGATWKIGRKR